MEKAFLISTIILILANVSYSNEKKYLPIDEKLRTLSLPPKTWKLDLGADFAFGQENDTFEFDFDDGLINFQFPYLPIGKRVELHFLTPMLKVYPVKNTIEQDSFIIANGPNLAIIGGLTGILYSSKDGFGLSYGIGYQFKTETGYRTWFFSNGLGTLDLEMYWSSNISIGTGFQMTKKFAIIGSARGSIYKYIVYYSDPYQEKSYIGYSINIPIDFKFNISRRNGFLIRTGFKYKANTFNYITFKGVLIGFQYSWHW